MHKIQLGAENLAIRLFKIELLIAGLMLAGAGPLFAADWPHWRGLGDNGSTEKGTYPVKWDATNVLWKAPLPGKGCSTPIVWNQHIFLTAPSNGMDGVLAFDWAGKPVWQTALGPEQAGKHRNGSGCNPSPVTDGHAVFVYFYSGTLAALDLEGKVRWRTNLVAGFGPDTLYWDQGTSPVLTRDDVVIARMHHGESWLAAFDKVTGRMHWKVSRNYETPEEGDNAYTTPLVIEHQGKEVLLVWGGQHLTAHDASDGRLLWCCGDFNPQAVANWPAVASPVIAGDIVVVACGRADHMANPASTGSDSAAPGTLPPHTGSGSARTPARSCPRQPNTKGGFTCCGIEAKSSAWIRQLARPFGGRRSRRSVPIITPRRWSPAVCFTPSGRTALCSWHEWKESSRSLPRTVWASESSPHRWLFQADC